VAEWGLLAHACDYFVLEMGTSQPDPRACCEISQLLSDCVNRYGKLTNHGIVRADVCGAMVGMLMLETGSDQMNIKCCAVAVHTLERFSQDSALACPLILEAITEHRAFGTLSQLMNPPLTGPRGPQQDHIQHGLRGLLNHLSRWNRSRCDQKLTHKLNQFLDGLLLAADRPGSQ